MYDDDIATHNSDGYSGQLLINMLNFLRIWRLRRAYVWGNLWILTYTEGIRIWTKDNWGGRCIPNLNILSHLPD